MGTKAKDTSIVLTGACFCRAVRYQLVGAVKDLCCCHCDSCRRASGAPYVAWGTVLADQFQLLEGELQYHASSPYVQRGFCSLCGTNLSYGRTDNTNHVDIALATLDRPDSLRPNYHIWVEDKLSWVVINDGLPQYQRGANAKV